MTLLPPVGGERSQSSPTARSHGFAQIIGDFINAIDPKRTAQASGFWQSYDMLCLSSSQEID
jgi:hypothetical protein